MKRRIDKIIVHCSAGSQRNKASDIVSYHTRAVSEGGRGWSVPGYHWIVEADGTVVATLPEDKVSNGCYGQNQHAVNVCYIGGVDCSVRGLPPVDNRTEAQRVSLRRLLMEIKGRHPGAVVYGHRDFAAKACPSFDARREYRDI